jgi:glycosyl transferase, family 25
MKGRDAMAAECRQIGTPGSPERSAHAASSALGSATIVPMERLLTLVINLDRAVERRARITASLLQLGLAWTRLPAVDARQLSVAQRAALDTAAYQRKHGMTPLDGELGCYLSHVEAMERFLASDAEFALILEDDVLPGGQLPAVLQALMAHPQRWDMVKLSAVHSGTPVPVLGLTETHRLAVMLSRCTGSSAYLVNRSAAAAYRDGLLPMSLPYDHVFDQGWRFALKVRLVTPPPCTHDEGIASTIVSAPGSQPRKFHWTRRWATYGYRIGNEWRRLRYGLSETWHERRHS